MKYQEIYGDLFDYEGKALLVHCISDDYALDAGIAVMFNLKYNMSERLKAVKPLNPKFSDTQGHCIRMGDVFNLITKDKYFHKPTYETLQNALDNLKIQIKYSGQRNVVIAMPLIGCGLDKLKWKVVSQMIQDTFDDTEWEIIIVKERKK